MHVIFYSVIANEKEFNLTDVINNQRLKLIERHPHIYGDVKFDNEKDVKGEFIEVRKNKNLFYQVFRSLLSYLKTYRNFGKGKVQVCLIQIRL